MSRQRPVRAQRARARASRPFGAWSALAVTLVATLILTTTTPAQGGEVPSGQAPGDEAPGGESPESPDGELPIPETPAPETSIPETSILEGPAPEALDGESVDPETTTPEADEGEAVAGTMFDDRPPIDMRTADGPELPEWTPILGGMHIGCTTGNPNPSGVRDHTCHSYSRLLDEPIPYHPWPAIDLYAPGGTPIRAAGAGTVISVGHTTTVPESDPLNPFVSDEALAARAGGFIVIAHAGGPNSVYKHSGEWTVVPGDHVEPGQVIGAIGYPATSTPHVHYDEQDPDARFNEPEARVPFGTMRARSPGGELINYPDALGTTDWNEVNQRTVLDQSGWEHLTTAASEAELRAAVTAYATSDDDGPFTIELRADIALTGGPLQYGGDELLMIDGDADHDGQRFRLTASSGSRLIEAPDPDAALEFRGVNLSGNGAVAGDGGLVAAAGPVSMVNAEASGGETSGSGGAVSSGEFVTLQRSNLFGNVAAGDGGAVRAARVAVIDSAVHHNVAGGGGGGLSSTGVPQPGAHIGGEFAQTDANRLSNSTISLNQAAVGGGVATDGDLYVQNTTVHQNTATSAADSVAVVGKLTTASTAFSTLPDRSNCQTGLTRSLGGNLDSADSCGLADPSDITSSPARLGTLRMNGGPTPTHYPLAGSPLIDAFTELSDDVKGFFSHAPPCSPTGRAADQRSSGRFNASPATLNRSRKPRPHHGQVNAQCDIGAIEATYPDHRYTDVPAWVDAAIKWISSDERDTPRIMGPNTSSFEPDDSISRAEVVNALYGFAGRPDPAQFPGHDMTDVPPWIDAAVSWVSHDPPGPGGPIMTGYPNRTFRGDQPISRAELVRALQRLTGRLPEAVPAPRVPGFTDVPPWVEAAVRWATIDHDGAGAARPIMTGYSDATFRPSQPITRAQVARALYMIAATPVVWNAGDGTPVDADSDLTVSGQGFPLGAFWVPL